MLGAIIGDMVGSIYEWIPMKSKNFNIYDSEMFPTDDSYLTIAVAESLMKYYPIDYSDKKIEELKDDLRTRFRIMVDKHDNAGFGYMFYTWAKIKSDKPYNSFGNGGAMRISPVGWVAKDIDEAKRLSKVVTEITHNHPEGLKGAEAVAVAVFLARTNHSKEEIKKEMLNYYPEIDNIDYNDLLINYNSHYVSARKSVPQAIYCFLISNSLEDAIRNAVSIGGDSDTIACITGSIAEAYYNKGFLSELEEKYLYFLIEPSIEKVIKKFHKTVNSGKIFKKEG